MEIYLKIARAKLRIKSVPMPEAKRILSILI